MNPRHVLYLLFVLALSSCKVKQKPEAGGIPSGGNDVNRRAAFIEAQSLETIGQLDAALLAYDKCASMDPTDGAPYFAKAEIYRRMVRYPEAIANAEKAYSLDKNNPWYVLMLAELTFEYGDFERSAGYFATVTQKFPENERYFFAHAECLVRTGRYQEAIKVYDNAEKLVGPVEELFRQKFLLYNEIGQPEKAQAELDKMVALDPTNPMMLLQKAEALESAGRVEEAYETYTRVLEIDPGNGHAHLGRARYLESINAEADVPREMEKAFRSKQLEIDTKVKILLDYYDQTGVDPHYLQESYMLLNALLETHPDDPKAYSIYGDFLSRDNRNAEARDMFLKSVRLAPDNFVLWNEVVMLDAQLGDFDSLYVHGSEAVALFPNQAGFYYFAGLGAAQTKKHDDAIRMLKEGMNYLILPDQKGLETEFWQTLGDAYYGKGDKTQAYVCYDKVLEAQPENVYVLNNYAYYLSLDGQNLDKAAAMAMKANKIEPDRPSYMDTYGWVLFKQEQYTDAEFWIKKAMDKGGESAAILEHYGDVQYKLGNAQQALTYWKKAAAAGKPSDALNEKIRTGKLD
jgi:tetratricopeptide (TPR) repeat protein